MTLAQKIEEELRIIEQLRFSRFDEVNFQKILQRLMRITELLQEIHTLIVSRRGFRAVPRDRQPE